MFNETPEPQRSFEIKKKKKPIKINPNLCESEIKRT